MVLAVYCTVVQHKKEMVSL